MATAQIGVKVRAASGYPTLYRVIGTTLTQIGGDFCTVIYTPVLGTFLVNDAITTTMGGTGTVTQVLTTPDRLVIHNPSGDLTGTITGAPSGATGTTTSVEGLDTDALFPGYQHYGNRGLNFANRVYALVRNTVYRLNETTGRVEEVFRADPNDATTGQQTGLHVVPISSIPHILWLGTGGTGVNRFRSLDGTTWSTLNVAVTSLNLAANRDLLFGDVLYSFGTGVGSGNSGCSFDPATDTFSVLGLGSSGLYNFNFGVAVHQGRLFVLGTLPTGEPRLAEFASGSLVSRGNLDTETQNVGTVFPHPILVTLADGNLYAVYFIDSAGSGWKIAKIVVAGMSFTVTDKTTPMQEPTLAPGGGAGTDTGRWESFLDDESGAAATDNDTPDFYVSFAATDGSAATRTQFLLPNDDTGTLTTTDTGSDAVGISMPDDGRGGGAHTFTSGQLSLKTGAARVPVNGGFRHSFRLYQKPGDPSVGSVKFRYLYREVTEATKCGSAGRWAVMSNPSVGALSPGNKEITGLTADGGATLYTVDVLIVSGNGVANFSRVNARGHAYT